MVDLNERCPTGIHGLDELIEGGYPRGRSVLISGPCGTGKSTFGVQFIYNGLIANEEPGVLVTLEERSIKLRKDMLRFGFDLEAQENRGKLAIVDKTVAIPELTGLEELIISYVNKVGAKRLVIDSLGAIDFFMNDVEKMRASLLSLSERVDEMGLTTLIMSESPESGEQISLHGFESYILSGVILLTIHSALDARKLEIRKMRGTKHSLMVMDFEFMKEGIAISNGPKKRQKSKKSIL